MCFQLLDFNDKHIRSCWCCLLCIAKNVAENAAVAVYNLYPHGCTGRTSRWSVGFKVRLSVIVLLDLLDLLFLLFLLDILDIFVLLLFFLIFSV